MNAQQPLTPRTRGLRRRMRQTEVPVRAAAAPGPLDGGPDRVLSGGRDCLTLIETNQRQIRPESCQSSPASILLFLNLIIDLEWALSMAPTRHTGRTAQFELRGVAQIHRWRAIGNPRLLAVEAIEHLQSAMRRQWLLAWERTKWTEAGQMRFYICPATRHNPSNGGRLGAVVFVDTTALVGCFDTTIPKRLILYGQGIHVLARSHFGAPPPTASTKIVAPPLGAAKSAPAVPIRHPIRDAPPCYLELLVTWHVSCLIVRYAAVTRHVERR